MHKFFFHSFWSCTVQNPPWAKTDHHIHTAGVPYVTLQHLVFWLMALTKVWQWFKIQALLMVNKIIHELFDHDNAWNRHHCCTRGYIRMPFTWNLSGIFLVYFWHRHSFLSLCYCNFVAQSFTMGDIPSTFTRANLIFSFLHSWFVIQSTLMNNKHG